MVYMEAKAPEMSYLGIIANNTIINKEIILTRTQLTNWEFGREFCQFEMMGDDYIIIHRDRIAYIIVGEIHVDN